MVELVTFSVPTVSIPPPAWAAVLLAIVLLTIVGSPLRSLAIAPPSNEVLSSAIVLEEIVALALLKMAPPSVPELFMKVLSLTVRVPALLSIAPPWNAAPPVKVLLVTVSVPVLSMAPPTPLVATSSVNTEFDTASVPPLL